MKANEFDLLIKEKFEQNDFEYNPAQWSRLSIQMDKKIAGVRRNRWLLPTAIGIAASFTLFAAVYIAQPEKTTTLVNNSNPASEKKIISKNEQQQIVGDINNAPLQRTIAAHITVKKTYSQHSSYRQ